MLSHCLNDVCSDSLQSIEENAQPEVFLEQEPSKVFFSSVASDVKIALQLHSQSYCCSACLKDLDNLTRSFDF
jgi:hypothetical protein